MGELQGDQFLEGMESLCCFPTTREAPAELPESHFNLQGGKSNLDRDRKATEDPTWGARVRQV